MERLSYPTTCPPVCPPAAAAAAAPASPPPVLAIPTEDPYLLSQHPCSFSPRPSAGGREGATPATGPGRPRPKRPGVSGGAAADPAALVSSFLGPRLGALQVSGANAKPCLSAQPPGPDVSCLVLW